jgi:hypothetical protein
MPSMTKFLLCPLLSAFDDFGAMIRLHHFHDAIVEIGKWQGVTKGNEQLIIR